MPWQSQFKDLKSRAAYLLETKELADDRFDVGNEQVRVHRLIIQMATPGFDEFFNGYGRLSIEPDVLQSILKYIYTDVIDIGSTSDVQYRLWKASVKHLLPVLEEACYKAVTRFINIQNVLYAYEMAIYKEDSGIINKCEEIIKSKTAEVLATSEFESACFNVVLKMFSLDSLNIDSEVVLLKALNRYNRHHRNRIQDELCNSYTVQSALEKIRFLTLSAEEFVEGCSGVDLLDVNESSAVLSNIVSRRTDKPMPHNFSLSRQHRKKGFELTPAERSVSKTELLYRIKDLLSLKGKVWGSRVLMHDVAWSVELSLPDGEGFASFFVKCEEKNDCDWSCKAWVECRLVRAQMDSLERQFTHVYDANARTFGFQDLIAWEELVDPSFNYLQDGSLTLQVTLKAEDLKVNRNKKINEEQS